MKMVIVNAMEKFFTVLLPLMENSIEEKNSLKRILKKMESLLVKTATSEILFVEPEKLASVNQMKNQKKDRLPPANLNRLRKRRSNLHHPNQRALTRKMHQKKDHLPPVNLSLLRKRSKSQQKKLWFKKAIKKKCPTN
jgi:hypothetical protein